MAIVQPTEDKTQFRERILHAIRDMYSDVAVNPHKEFHFPTGRRACEALGYQPEELNAIPPMAVESFAGVGYPFRSHVIQKGDHVLDIGSGSGTDMLIAALKTGPSGTVHGLDITDSMLSKAKENIDKMGVENVFVVKGNTETLPLEDERFDVVTSNGVLNLVPDKKKAFREISRVLKPGGRIQIADIALKNEISEKCRLNPELWAECIVGAIPEDIYIDMLEKAGFSEIQLLDQYDYFSLSPNDSTKKTAMQYGAVALTLTANKA